jgi:hypothetical protein
MHPSVKFALDRLAEALDRQKQIGNRGYVHTRQQKRREEFQKNFNRVSLTARANQYLDRRELTPSRKERRATARELSRLTAEVGF